MLKGIKRNEILRGQASELLQPLRLLRAPVRPCQVLCAAGTVKTLRPCRRGADVVEAMWASSLRFSKFDADIYVGDPRDQHYLERSL